MSKQQMKHLNLGFLGRFPSRGQGYGCMNLVLGGEDEGNIRPRA